MARDLSVAGKFGTMGLDFGAVALPTGAPTIAEFYVGSKGTAIVDA